MEGINLASSKMPSKQRVFSESAKILEPISEEMNTRWGPGIQGLCFKTSAHWK